MACEGRASGVSCHIRRPIWQPIGYPAAPTHPPHAIGTRAPLGDQNTSIEASFYFSVQRSLKYPHVRPQMGNFATASRRESDPFPQPGLGAYKGTLWDPAAKIAPGQVARNSNLKFGVRPSTLAIKQPMRIKTRTKANINAAVINSAGRPIPGTRGQGAGPEISLAGSLRKNRGRVRVAPATTSCRYTSQL